MKIKLANPRGFCAGVDRAITIVNRALELFGAPIYVRHEVVHNRPVVDSLIAKGVIFTDHIEDVPPGSTLIYSAHGVSKAVREAAKQRKLNIFDATCPLVTKVHMEVARCARLKMECILIGHAGHTEVEGTIGQYDCAEAGIYLVETVADVDQLALKNPDFCAVTTQTTLSMDDTQTVMQALKNKFPKIIAPKNKDICYATQNRQDAVKQLAMQCNKMIVVGSVASSNSNRLKELSDRLGCKAFLVDSSAMLKQEWFDEDDIVGVTAGASAAEHCVQTMIAQLKAWGADNIEELPGVEETIVFVLPQKLRDEK
jgi:4-hydroxy-3-methylbut-2-en-1-yl diphosphate reductase